MTINNIRV